MFQFTLVKKLFYHIDFFFPFISLYLVYSFTFIIRGKLKLQCIINHLFMYYHIIKNY